MLMKKMGIFCRVLLVCLAVLMAFSGCASDSSRKSVSKFINYEPVGIENEMYSLDITEEGRIVLQNKADGSITYGWPEKLEGKNAAKNQIMSALKIQCYITNTNGVETSYSYPSSVLKGGLTVEKKKDEIVATYYFDIAKITIPVHYTLCDGGMVVTVLPDEIKEEGNARIMELSLHQYFGGASTDKEGFMLVPDGSGGIIEFNQINSSTYRQKVYGIDQTAYNFTVSEKTATSLLPFFATATMGKGYTLGVISGGAADAFIDGTAGNDFVTYNTVYPTFNMLAKDIRDYPDDYRVSVDILPEKSSNTGPMQVTYFVESSNFPSYMDMAERYREYLVKKYDLQRIEKAAYPLALDITMSTIKNQSFLGVPYEGVEVLTTSKQAQEIVDYFKKNGINTIVKLNNWSKQTVWSDIPDGASHISKLGTKSEFGSLIDTACTNGSLYLNNSLSVVYGGGLVKKSRYYAKNINNSEVVLQQYNLVSRFREAEEYYLLSNSSVIKFANAYSKKLNSLYEDRVGVCIDNLNTLYTDFSNDDYSLTATANAYKAAVESFGATDCSIAVNGGGEYIMGDVNYLFDMPSGDSGYDLVSYEIPFCQIVLHGYIPYSHTAVNTCANPQREMLKTLECGAFMEFEFVYSDAESVRYSKEDKLYNANFLKWCNTALDCWKKYSAVQQERLTQLITNHTVLADGIALTEYENGDKIVVNYTNKAFEYNGIEVSSMGFAEIKED